MKRKAAKKGPQDKWDDSFYVKGYQLARTGLKGHGLAEALGVSLPTLKKWKRERPAFAQAVEEGRKGPVGTQTFSEYVYARLPQELQEVWDRINGPEADNGLAWLESVLEGHGKVGRQRLFLHALIHYNFNASEACRSVGITKATFDEWATDPGFADLIKEMEWHKDNMYEAGLVGLVRAGDVSATLFANRTRLRHRGYDPKVTVQHEGQVNHAVAVVQIDPESLPLHLQKQLLNHVNGASQPLALEPHGEVIEAEVIDDGEES